MKLQAENINQLSNARAWKAKCICITKLQRYIISQSYDDIAAVKPCVRLRQVMEWLALQKRYVKLHYKNKINLYFQVVRLTWLVFAQNLKELYIKFCNDVEEIISVDKLSDISDIIGSEHNFFSQLEYLFIRWGPNLKSVYPNPLPFPKLKKIEVRGCPQLKKLPLNSSSAKERRVVIEGEKKW